MRRQTAMPLAVSLSTFCPGYAGLCLMEEYLGVGCAACCLARPENAGTLMASLETFSGLCQLGIEAVQIRGRARTPASLARVIGLYQSVATASPMERPRVLAAARQVVEAFGEDLRMSPPPPETRSGPPVYPLPPSQRSVYEFLPARVAGPGPHLAGGPGLCRGRGAGPGVEGAPVAGPDLG